MQRVGRVLDGLQAKFEAELRGHLADAAEAAFAIEYLESELMSAEV